MIVLFGESTFPPAMKRHLLEKFTSMVYIRVDYSDADELHKVVNRVVDCVYNTLVRSPEDVDMDVKYVPQFFDFSS
jgi:hypothetical protein